MKGKEPLVIWTSTAVLAACAPATPPDPQATVIAQGVRTGVEMVLQDIAWGVLGIFGAWLALQAVSWVMQSNEDARKAEEAEKARALAWAEGAAEREAASAKRREEDEARAGRIIDIARRERRSALGELEE